MSDAKTMFSQEHEMPMRGDNIASGEIQMRFLKRKLLNSDAKWDAAMAAYGEHLKSIQDDLPDVARRLLKWNFHDEQVKAIRRIDPQTIWIELTQDRLELYGVSRAIYPKNDQLDRTVWLYDEVDFVAPGVFALRALFDRDGIEVDARDAKIFRPSMKRYVLPPEPPPPPPTLFAEKTTRHSIRRKGKKRR